MTSGDKPVRFVWEAEDSEPRSVRYGRRGRALIAIAVIGAPVLLLFIIGSASSIGFCDDQSGSAADDCSSSAKFTVGFMVTLLAICGLLFVVGLHYRNRAVTEREHEQEQEAQRSASSGPGDQGSAGSPIA